MRGSIKKLIPLALAVVFVITAAIPAAAAPAASTAAPEKAVQDAPPNAGMETALVAVKAIISIDEDVYTDFSYSSSYSNYETREGLVWWFNWSDANYSSINASVTADGKLLSYGKYDYDKDAFGFSEVSRDKASAVALDFLKKASPVTYSYYSMKGEPEISINHAEYTLNYVAKVNGHSFSAASISVSVNKFTGDVTSYYTRNVNPKGYTFESASKTIGTDAAVKAYADKLGLTLEYRSNYDYESNKLSIFPVYLFNSSGDKYISAVTGDVVTYVYDRGADGEKGAYEAEAPMMNGAASADSAAGGSRLTPQEIAAIDKVKGFITSDEALKKLLSVMGLSDIDVAAFSESYINLNKDYVNRDRYIYNVNLYTNTPEARADSIYYVNGRVDAETGRVLSFSYGYNAEPVEASKLLTEAQAQAAVDKFIKANAPDELKKVKLDSVQSPVEEKYYGNQSYCFNYYRVENGVPFRNNGINVTLDARTGKITSYSLEWYLNAEFPSVKSVLTPEKALAGYVAQNGALTDYITVGGGKASLVYNFSGWYFIDPFTGKAIDYNGELRKDTKAEKPDYSDVKGHWSEKYVTRLLENGVYQWGGKFEPERAMTQLEFLQYLMEIEPYYQVEPLTYFKDHGITTDIKADEKTPVTRQEAARIIAEYMGYGKLAEKSKWFAYPFTGAVDDAYKGFITVCCMLGIITETGGDYNAKANVTRAEAAMLLHNLILAKSEG